jgi:hypothetical protein
MAGPYIAEHPESFVGKQVGTSHWCTDFVKAASGAPPASLWHRGEMVYGNLTLKVGTAIACGWDGMLYASHQTGNHAAIYAGQKGEEIYVWDQSQTTMVELRTKHHDRSVPYYVIM